MGWRKTLVIMWTTRSLICVAVLTLAFAIIIIPASQALDLHNQGLMQIDFSPPESHVFIGSPSIAIMPNGALLASHDTFYNPTPAQTHIFTSLNRGLTWLKLAIVSNQYWSSLFLYDNKVYLLGTTHCGRGAEISIAESVDGGATWNRTTLISPPSDCSFATGSVTVVQTQGYILRSFESWCHQTLHWPQSYQSHVAYAPVGSDLADPESWRVTEGRPFDPTTMIPSWFPDPITQGGFLEGSVVQGPGDKIYLMMRCLFNDVVPGRGTKRRYEDGNEAAAAIPVGMPIDSIPYNNNLAREYTLQHACMFEIVDLGPTPHHLQISMDNRKEARLAWKGVVSMPGGGNKFNIIQDPKTKVYVSLTNPSIDRYGVHFDARNKLTLIWSINCRDWRVAKTVLEPNDGFVSWEESLLKTGYHYSSLLIDGDDIVAVIRTAWDGADSYHNSNRLTFKRIEKFRDLLELEEGRGSGIAIARKAVT